MQDIIKVTKFLGGKNMAEKKDLEKRIAELFEGKLCSDHHCGNCNRYDGYKGWCYVWSKYKSPSDYCLYWESKGW